MHTQADPCRQGRRHVPAGVQVDTAEIQAAMIRQAKPPSMQHTCFPFMLLLLQLTTDHTSCCKSACGKLPACQSQQHVSKSPLKTVSCCTTMPAWLTATQLPAAQMVPVFRLHRGRTHAMHSGLEAIRPVTYGPLIQEPELMDGTPSGLCLLTVPERC